MLNIPGRAALSGIQSGAPTRAGPRLLLNVPLRLERRLPLPGAVEVHQGQEVAPETVLATAPNTPSRLAVIELTQVFERQLTPEEVHQAVIVQPGQPVHAGQIVARTPRQGWFERDQDLRANSPVTGIVEFVSVGRGQIVIRTNTEMQQERLALPVASYLSIEPSELPEVAVCRPGEQVEAGDPLARMGGFRPISGDYRSPVSGIVESVSPLTGMITIVRERKPLVLRSTLQGWVERVHPGYGALIGSFGHKVLGVLGLGGKSWGRLVPVAELMPANRGPIRALTAKDVLPDHAGCVLTVPGPVDYEALCACRNRGVRGIVAASTSARELGEFLGRPLAAEIVTGPGVLALSEEDRDVTASGDGTANALTVIITEGFGRLTMEEETWLVLSGHAGTMVSLDGLTQIRAGVVRPSVFIPLGGGPRSGLNSQPVQGSRDEAVPPALAAGQRVRIVRHPYFGLRGVVVEPPGGLERLETEVEARVLMVQLDDGRRVRVAEANIEF